METIDDGEGRGDGGERGGRDLCCRRQAGGAGWRAKGAGGGRPTQQVWKWESRCCRRRYESRCCHWRGSHAAVIGGLSRAVVLAVIVRIDPLTEKEKAG